MNTIPNILEIFKKITRKDKNVKNQHHSMSDSDPFINILDS